MDPYHIQESKSPFKKKHSSNLGTDSSLTSSVRHSFQNAITDEKYLTLEKEFKKLQKSHTELIEQYNKMKNIAIIEKANLQLDLHEAKQNLQSMAEENTMLNSRIDFLQKECNSQARHYQRPLNRSMVRSITPGKRSRIQKENVSSLLNLSRPNENFEEQERAQKKKIKTERSLHDDQFYHQNEQFDCPSNGVVEVKFNPSNRKQQPLIKEESQRECFHGDQTCRKNYKELEELRQTLARYGNQMEEIYLQLKLSFDERSGLQELADQSQDLLKLCEKNAGKSFFYQSKPDLMMKKVQKKVRTIIIRQKKASENPQIELIKQKMAKILKTKKEMDEDGENEAFKSEAWQKEIERLEQNQKNVFNLASMTFKPVRRQKPYRHLFQG